MKTIFPLENGRRWQVIGLILLACLCCVRPAHAQWGNPPPDCLNAEQHWYICGAGSCFFWTCSDPNDEGPTCPSGGSTGGNASGGSGGGGGGGQGANPIGLAKWPGGGGSPGCCGQGPGGGGGGGGGSDPCCELEEEGEEGMPVWSVLEPNLSVFLRDKPLFYNPSRGREVAFQLRYKGKPGQNGATDMGQPGIFTLGTNWHSPWRSYLQYAGPGDPAVEGSQAFFIFLGDGSARQFITDRVEHFSRAFLTLTNNEYTLFFPGGSRAVYNQKVTMSGNDYWFLSRKEDPSGNALTFSYAFTTNSGGATNSIRLDTVTDVDNRDTTFVYTNNGNYSNILIEVQGPHGLTATLVHDSSTQLTNVTDVVSLSTRIEYDGSQRLSKLTTPYGTNTFIYYSTNGATALRVDEVGLRQHLHLEGYNGTNVFPTALSESAALNSYMTNSIGVEGTVETNSFDELNTFYWGPRQYANLPSAIRTTLTNLTFNPADLTTNDLKLGWSRHWLRARNTNVVVRSSTLSVERAPSPDVTGVTEGLLTWYDYDGKNDVTFPDGTWDYASAYQLPRIIASREPGQDWRASYFQRHANGHVTRAMETYGVPGNVLWRTTTYEYAANQIDLTMVIENGVTNALNVYNEFHQVTTNYNALNEETLYTYEGSQRLSTITRPNDLVTTYTYDGSSGFLSTVIDSYSGSNLRTNSYTWTNGYVLTHTDERSLSITNTWDVLGRLTKTANRDGAINHTYEKLDLVKTLDRMGFTNGYAYNGFRELLRHTNANQAVTTYTYCNCGSLESISDPLNNSTSYTYDNLGRSTRTTFPGNSYLDSVYDLLGNVVRTTDNLAVSVTNFYTIHGLAYTASNAFGRVFLRSFDEDDRLIGSIDQNSVGLGFSYDDLGRLLVRTNRTYYDAGSDFFHVWADRYDYTNDLSSAVAMYREYVLADGFSTHGFLFSTTERIGELITYDYDLFARKTNEVHWDLDDVAVLTNSFAYNAAGDLTKLTDGKAQITTWKYDDFGRVTNKLDAANAELFRYTYDANSRLTTRWTPEKLTTAYSYDAMGNLTLVNYTVSPDVTLQYDALNRVTNMVDAVGATAYSFTAFGALQTEDGPWADDTVSYSYTANRLRSGLSLTHPSASAWSQSYAYDAANRLSTITSPAGTFGYEYGSVGADSTPSQLIRQLTLPNGSAITNLFDDQARQLGTWLHNSGGTNLNSNTYDYNDLDQRINQTRAGAPASGPAWTNFVDYGYDALGQLVDATGKESGGTTNRVHERFGYFYDAAGNLNRRTNNALVQTFTVNNLNQLSNATRSGTLTVAGFTFTPASSVTVNTLTADRYADYTFARTNLSLSDGNNTFTAIATDSLSRGDTNAITVNLPATLTFLYDQNGNLRTNGTRIFEYDDENQLICIKEPGAWMCTNVYDGKMRRRIERNHQWTGTAWQQTNEARFDYDGNVILQERSEFNLPRVTLTRGLDLSGSLQGAGGIGGILSMSEHSASTFEHSYFHADGNGNVTALVSSNQQMVARYLYDPFGNTLSATGPKASVNRYRFSSKPIHEPLGMYDFLYRWYAPELQRWVNRDPIADRSSPVTLGLDALSVSAELNLFQFVRNEPTGIIDLWGLLWVAFGQDNSQDSTFVCDGNGGIRPKLCPRHQNLPCGLDDCVTAHENSHISDVLAERPNICKGKKDNTGIWQTYYPDLWKSEIKGHNAAIACAKALIPNASPACQNDINDFIKAQEDARDGYQDELDGWRRTH